jgi:hypothetical protein
VLVVPTTRHHLEVSHKEPPHIVLCPLSLSLQNFAVVVVVTLVVQVVRLLEMMVVMMVVVLQVVSSCCNLPCDEANASFGMSCPHFNKAAC